MAHGVDSPLSPYRPNLGHEIVTDHLRM